jgi:hypothetical protein
MTWVSLFSNVILIMDLLCYTMLNLHVLEIQNLNVYLRQAPI